MYKYRQDSEWKPLGMSLTEAEVKKQMKKPFLHIQEITDETPGSKKRLVLQGYHFFRKVYALKFNDGREWNADDGWLEGGDKG